MIYGYLYQNPRFCNRAAYNLNKILKKEYLNSQENLCNIFLAFILFRDGLSLQINDSIYSIRTVCTTFKRIKKLRNLRITELFISIIRVYILEVNFKVFKS